MRTFLAVLLLATSCAVAADAPSAKIAPSAETAADQLKNSPRHGEWVEIPVGDTKLKTWVVYPERKDKAPVVLVICEIFGMSDWVRGVADQLAAEGFIAVAPDFLSGKGPNGGGTESFSDSQVRQMIMKVSPDEVAKDLDAARDWALAQPSASSKTGTIGFCWGGGMSFNYATHQPKLNAAAVYYGVPPKTGIDKIECPVLGCYGEMDNRITSTVEATKKQMEEAKKSYDPHVYDHAGHGFLRQQSGQDGANQKAAEQAWPTTIEFFKKNLE